MTKTLKTIFLLLLLCAGLQATTLTGSIKYPDGTGVTGRLLLALSQDASLSNAGSCGGFAAISPTFQVTITLSAGSMVSPPAIFGNDCLVPQGTFYNVQVKDQNGNLLWVDKWQINGTTQDIGQIIPSTTAGTVSTAVLLLNPPFNVDQSVAGNILPDVTAARSLGNNTTRWNGFFNNLTTTNILSTPIFQGTPIFSGTTQFQASSAPAPIGGIGQIYYDNVCNCFLISNGGAFATLGTTTLGNNYQTVMSGGSAQVQRPTVNFPSGACADNSGSSRTDCLFAGAGTGGVVTLGNAGTNPTYVISDLSGGIDTIKIADTTAANTTGSQLVLTAAKGKGTGNGGPLIINGGATDATCVSSCGVGGTITLFAGQVGSTQGGQGGGITLTAASGGNAGGDINIDSGNGGFFAASTTARGGNITLAAGSALNGNNNGGELILVPGPKIGTGTPGGLTLSNGGAGTPVVSLSGQTKFYYDLSNNVLKISTNASSWSILENSINSAVVHGSNFNNASPGAPSNGYNVHWQHSGSSGIESISAYFLTTDVGTTTWSGGSTSIWTWNVGDANTLFFAMTAAAATNQNGSGFQLNAASGNGVGTGGSLTLLSGSGGSGGGSTGTLSVKSADSQSSGSSASGTVTLASGAIVSGSSGTSGTLSLNTGANAGSGGSGTISLASGNVTGTALASGSGSVTITSGNVTTGNSGSSGALNLNTGTVNGNGSTGNITVQPGTPQGGSSLAGSLLLSGATGVAAGGVATFQGGTSGSVSNVPGGQANVLAGLGTGNSTPARVHIKGDALGTASGTSTQSVVNRIVSNGTKTGLTSGSATSILSTAFPTQPSAVGGHVVYSVEFSDGTDVCMASGTVNYAAVKKAGTVTSTVTPTEVTKCTGTATIADAWATTAADPTLLQVTPTITNMGSITVNRITYTVFNDGQGDTTPQ